VDSGSKPKTNTVGSQYDDGARGPSVEGQGARVQQPERAWRMMYESVY
jgi:hypothetical protein